MAKTPKKSKDDFSTALASLRKELQQDVSGLSKSVEQLKESVATNDSQSDRLALANSVQALRQELRHETNNLSQLIEQAQAEQAETLPLAAEVDTSEFLKAIDELRTELNRDVQSLSQSIRQLEQAQASQPALEADTSAFSEAVESLRSELHGEASGLSDTLARIEQSQSSTEIPALDSSEFTHTVDALRSEFRRDMHNLSQTIARTEPVQPRRSPAPVALGMLACLILGGLGTYVYQVLVNPARDADLLAQLDTIANPTTGQLQQQRALLDQLVEERASSVITEQQTSDVLRSSITDLESKLAAQETRIDDGFTKVTEDLASAVSRIAAGKVTTVAKPPIEETEAESGAMSDDVAAASEEDAEADSDNTGSEAGADTKPALDKVQNIVQSPVGAKVIIDNPSRFAFKLLVNGESIDVAAGGATSVPVTQGAVTTQTPGYPTTAKEWNDWEVVDGEPRLTIKVEAGFDYYQLR